VSPELPCARGQAPAAVALALALAACSGSAGSAEGTASAAAPRAFEASADPRVCELRWALEFGRLDLARTLYEQVGALAGPEAPLLAARLALSAGDEVAALRAVEEARALSPGDPRPFATAAEIYASLGRFEAAARELSEGAARSAGGPELERARGVVLILQPGGAAPGLEVLEALHARAPKTPFLARPLSQAHLLAGRRLLGEGDGAAALAHAQKAAELDPDELDVKELEADALQSVQEYDQALALYAELEELGRDTRALQAEVHQRAATFDLLRRDRAQAIRHYRAARALGLDEEALGFGASVLAEEAQAVLQRGVAAYDAGDLAAARAAFAEALELDPGNLAAQNHLGVVLFHAGDYAGAAQAWERLLAAARASGVELPEPVELNLARAQKLAGRQDDARRTAEEFLARDPAGPHAVEAAELLRRL
jgi:tetratricopeptide (TPR) repeat protein